MPNEYVPVGVFLSPSILFLTSPFFPIAQSNTKSSNWSDALFFKNPKSSTEPKFKSKVDSGEYVETTRSPKIKGTFQHIYYTPKDFGTTTAQQSPEPYVGVPEGFVEIPKRKSRGRPRIPESKGGSFLFRGSDYEKGGATPAL